MEYYSSQYEFSRVHAMTCTSLEWNVPIYDIFSSVRLIGQTNRHLYKITPYKNTASNLLDYIEKEALRCNKENDFFTVDFGHVLGNEMCEQIEFHFNG